MPLPTPAPVLYRGLELLTFRPEGIDSPERQTRLVLPAAPFAGASAVPVWRGPAAPALPGAETFALTWCCHGRAALAALDAFFARRAGRLSAFWLPTSRQDATVEFRVDADGTYAVAAGTGYADAFPALVARAGLAGGGDDWLAVAPSGAGTALRVTAAPAQADGTTRLVGTAGPQDVFGTTAGGWAWTRLVVARLAEDTVTTRFLRGDLAVVDATAVTTVD